MNRGKNGLAREYFLFFVLNAVGLLIEIPFIGFVKYTADVDNQPVLNAAKPTGSVSAACSDSGPIRNGSSFPPAPPRTTGGCSCALSVMRT